MAGENSDDNDKQYEPTQKRLDEARKRGDLPMSQDLTTAGAYSGLIVVAFVAGQPSLVGLGERLREITEDADVLAASIFKGPASATVGRIMAEVSWYILPWLVGPTIGVLLAVAAQQSFKLAPTKLAPKLSRISPISNAKQKFGADGLFNFSKSFLKLVIFSFLLAAIIFSRLPEMLAVLYGSPRSLIGRMLELATEFLSIVLAISLAVGMIDLMWQRLQHTKKNRMSHKELQDETKESEGDQNIKQRRRQKGIDIATNRMIADVPKADVVIVNPTHYAVALQWERDGGRAPTCIAKGVDEIAARIREVAQSSGVPIRRDPSTARALQATMKIGEEVQPEYYRPVAAAIRFAEQVRKRAGLLT